MSTVTFLDRNLASSAKGWNIALWIAQVALALMFGMAGMMKLTTPMAELQAAQVGVGIPELLIRFIGFSELLAALGLLLPSLTRIRPQLTVAAAGGLVLVMILATIFHLVRGEFPAIGVTLLLGAVAAFVAWGRSSKARIMPRA